MRAIIVMLLCLLLVLSLSNAQLRDDVIAANEKLLEQQAASLAWKCRDYTGRTPLKGEFRVCQKVTGM